MINSTVINWLIAGPINNCLITVHRRKTCQLTITHIYKYNSIFFTNEYLLSNPLTLSPTFILLKLLIGEHSWIVDQVIFKFLTCDLASTHNFRLKYNTIFVWAYIGLYSFIVIHNCVHTRAQLNNLSKSQSLSLINSNNNSSIQKNNGVKTLNHRISF